MDTPDDDEWEYEYDENETEEFYVTLDLSGILPTGQEGIDPAYIPSEDRPRTGRPSYKKTKSKTTVTAASRLAAQASAPELAPQSETDTLDSSRIQIVDLHTSTPLIAYQGQLLSCHWASTVGTDMLFAKQDPDADSHHAPLRTVAPFDLLGLSSTKLMASTAQLRSRDNRPVIEKDPSPFPDQAARRRSSGTLSTSGANRQLKTSKARINQQNFLSRLGAANAKRKRDDESTMGLPMRSGRHAFVREGESPEDTSSSDAIFSMPDGNTAVAETELAESRSISGPHPLVTGGDVVEVESVEDRPLSVPTPSVADGDTIMTEVESARAAWTADTQPPLPVQQEGSS
ncbi:uncharacterized protein BDZ99DRAFT_499967 [Mytilinidion resinicola]|uniref:Transcription factor TFIIIC triple barrel domain-containing protein n=1 Tax=Mytilinidion resinicola TaxID=574789 RepID=A0A6A6YGG8_9PEZI|nr:uncharacterized protein BDZ99DRAFT_499967 [Mytilinidion resinicola]KAF2807623.1 hypothetical protein BDZ99DRAFT_499967 [Mytilinidion resinicola]